MKKTNKRKNKYSRQIDLEKERLKLKIKQQELEVQKSWLKLKSDYHPITVATDFAFELIDGPIDADDELGQEIAANAKDRRKYRIKKLRKASDVLIHLITVVEGILNGSIDVEKRNKRDDKQEYVIGKDDQ
ncbi:MAG: hypothetical protein ACPG5B_05945 [Chitinophagales bacterium]